MLRRPRAGEEDLEAMMTEFDKSNDSTSSVVNKRKSAGPAPEEPKKTKSLFSQRRRENTKDRETGEAKLEGSDRVGGNDLLSISVLSDIVEKELTELPVPPSLSSNTSFPAMLKLKEEEAGPRVSKQSLFAQQFMKMKQTLGEPALPSAEQMDVADEPVQLDSFGDKSFILEGSGLKSTSEAEEIHQQNVKKLESMSEAEILEEQKKLLENMDPTLLKFLASKRNMQNSAPSPQVAKEIESSQTTKVTESIDDTAQDSMEEEKEESLDASLRGFPNMNRDEPEKREWMSDIPKVDMKTDSVDGHSARFGFDGSLLDPNVQLDIQSGLYHHGEEAERAGYTVTELFTLLRSTNARQRVFALDTLAAIIDKFWTGVLDSCFNENLVMEMVQGGLVSLLRASLDEKEESVVFASANCLASLIAPQGEEAGLDWCSAYWPEMPDLQPVLEETEGVEDLTDHQLIQMDIIAGLVRMDILPRIRYIITVLRPGPGVVLSTLKVLIRLARHSASAANQIMQCPGLLQTILLEFLPPRLPSSYSNTSLYGAPVWLACKLCRTIAAWGKAMATALITEFHLLRSLIAYLTIDPSEAAIPSRESAQLCIESYRTWCMLLRYNLGVTCYRDLYPLLMKQLLYFIEKVDVAPAAEDKQFDYDIGCWLLTMLTNVLGCISFNSELAWTHVDDLRAPVEMCVKKWIHQVTGSKEPISTSASNLLGAALEFLSLFYIKIKIQEQVKLETLKSQIETDFAKPVNSFLHSKYYQRSCKSLVDYSGYLADAGNPERHLKSLPSAGAVLKNGALHPILFPNCPMFLMTSFFRFISLTRSLGCSLDTRDTAWEGLNVYVKKLLSLKSPSLSSNWFSRLESRLIFWSLSTHFHAKISEDVHRLALLTSALLQVPDHLLLRELMENIIFNTEVFQADHLVSSCMESLSLNSVQPFVSASCLPAEKQSQVFEDCLNKLSDIKDTYFNKLINDQQCHSSMAYHNYINKDMKRLCVRAETILAQDWQFFPLLQMYHMEQNGVRQPVSINDMKNCLLWLVLTKSEENPTASQLTARFFRLSTVFLAGNDLFLDPVINLLLSILLQRLLESGVPDLSLPVPGLTSNHEFYLQLLEQFQAVSYGDQLFSAFIVLPLSLGQPPAFRRSFWTEKVEMSRSITLTLQHFKAEVVAQFLLPMETELDILHAYFAAIQGHHVVKPRNDFLFNIAYGQLKKILNNPTEDSKLRHLQTSIQTLVDHTG